MSMLDDPAEQMQEQVAQARWWIAPALLILVAAVGTQVSFAIRPSILRQVLEAGLLYRIDPATLPLEIGAIFAATGSAVPLLIGGRDQARQAGGVLLTLSLLLGIVTWHHHSAVVMVRSTDLTAPTRGKLLPGEAVTIQLGEVRVMRFVGYSRGERNGYIQCQTAAKQAIELDLGPLSKDARGEVERAAQEAGVKIEHWN